MLEQRAEIRGRGTGRGFGCSFVDGLAQGALECFERCLERRLLLAEGTVDPMPRELSDSAHHRSGDRHDVSPVSGTEPAQLSLELCELVHDKFAERASIGCRLFCIAH